MSVVSSVHFHYLNPSGVGLVCIWYQKNGDYNRSSQPTISSGTDGIRNICRGQKEHLLLDKQQHKSIMRSSVENTSCRKNNGVTGEGPQYRLDFQSHETSRQLLSYVDPWNPPHMVLRCALSTPICCPALSGYEWGYFYQLLAVTNTSWSIWRSPPLVIGS